MNSVIRFIFTVAFFHSAATLADTVEVPVRASFKPSKATGILFSSRGAVERNPATIKSNDAVYLVSFEVSAEEKKAGLSASALLTNDEGQSAYGDVVQLTTATPSHSKLTLTECTMEQDQSLEAEIRKASENDLGPLLAIRDFRIKKASNERAHIREMLSGTLAMRLTKLENGLGLALSDDKPISGDLPAAELANRLSSLKIALESYIKVQSQIQAQSPQ